MDRWRAALSHDLDQTAGAGQSLCGDFAVRAIVTAVHWQGCAGVLVNSKTGHASIGITATEPVYGTDRILNSPVANELGTPSFGGSALIQSTDADHWKSLEGPSVSGGVSGGPIAVVGFVSPVGCDPVRGTEVGLSAGVIPVEGHIGVTTTAVKKLWGDDN